MNVEDAEEFTQAQEQIWAGSWRTVLWATRQGIPEALGLSTREWVEERLGGYVRLAVPDRRAAVVELVEDGMKQREVAEVLGLGERTVRKDLRSKRHEGRSDDEVPVEERHEGRSDDERAADLPDDLADRVESRGLSLDEAERVVREREKRLSVWRRKIVDALRVLARMADDPIPDELVEEMSNDEVVVLKTVLEALRGGTYGHLG